MKKITLLIAVMFSMSMFAERYLVQLGTGGAATWRAAGVGETLVDLTVNGQSFNAWYNATVVSNDEVWVAAGTYVLTGVVTITKANHSVYGGFAGTETAVSERVKNGVNPWEFTNPSVFDGDNAVQILLAANTYANVVFDGITFEKAKSANGAAQYRDGVTLQNCILKNNVSTADGGAVKLFQGGSLKNSYLVGNKAATHGGALQSNNATAGLISVISGCVFENNAANGDNGGGGIRIQGVGITNVSECVFKGNKSTNTVSPTKRPGAAISSNSVNINFVNCLIFNNEGGNTLYINGGNFTNCTIAKNVGGAYIASGAVVVNLTNIALWGNKKASDGLEDDGIFGYLANMNCVINNSALFPMTSGYTQANNITLEADNDSQDNARGPGFLNPTTFWGAPTDGAQTTEMNASDWSLKNTSGVLDLGKTITEITTDLAGTTRPQGAAYDIGAYEFAYYNTTVSFNVNGTVNTYTSGDVDSKPKGTQLAFTITPNSGYKIGSVLYNGSEVKDLLIDGVYTAPALTANSTLVVQFDLATGLQNSKVNFNCFGIHNAIEFSGLTQGDEIMVYNVAGAKVKSEKAINSSLSLSLPQGIYMVKVANQIKKVIVR